MNALTPAQRRDLRARAHHLDPVVSIAANGLSAAVLKEIENSLSAHELIKVRVYGDDRELRNSLMQAVCNELDCAPVQAIGKLLVIFRPKPAVAAASTSKPRPGTRKPLTPKPESGRTARTTTGTSKVRRLGSSAKLAPRRAGPNASMGRSGARAKPAPGKR